MSKTKVVFFHAFLIGCWENRFERFIDYLESSKLYDEVKSIEIVAVYQNSNELEKLKLISNKYDKMNIYFSRNHSEKILNFEPGESEGIMKMIEYSKESSEDIYFLFAHTKSVTPNWKNRIRPEQTYNINVKNYIEKRKSKISEVEDIRDEKYQYQFVENLYDEVIGNWKDHVNCLDSGSNYSHYLVNFFWIKSEILNKFDMNYYCKNINKVRHTHVKPFVPGGSRNGIPFDRHYAAMFSYKLDWIYGKGEDNYLASKKFSDL